MLIVAGAGIERRVEVEKLDLLFDLMMQLELMDRKSLGDEVMDTNIYIYTHSSHPLLCETEKVLRIFDWSGGTELLSRYLVSWRSDRRHVCVCEPSAPAARTR